MANTKKFSEEDAKALRDRGYSYKNIAIELGCSEGWVAKTLRGYGKEPKADVNGAKLAAILLAEEFLEKLRCL
jgi:predicted transcriptional regulator